MPEKKKNNYHKIKEFYLNSTPISYSVGLFEVTDSQTVLIAFGVTCITLGWSLGYFIPTIYQAIKDRFTTSSSEENSSSTTSSSKESLVNPSNPSSDVSDVRSNYSSNVENSEELFVNPSSDVSDVASNYSSTGEDVNPETSDFLVSVDIHNLLLSCESLEQQIHLFYQLSFHIVDMQQKSLRFLYSVFTDDVNCYELTPEMQQKLTNLLDLLRELLSAM